MQNSRCVCYGDVVVLESSLTQDSDAKNGHLVADGLASNECYFRLSDPGSRRTGLGSGDSLSRHALCDAVYSHIPSDWFPLLSRLDESRYGVPALSQ